MTKYIDAEKLTSKVKELNLATKTYEEQVAFNNALAMVVEIIDSLQQETDKNLEEAANKFAILDEEGKWKDGGKYRGFIAGAQWMENQFEHCGSFPIEDPNGGYWPTDYYIKKK